MDIYIYIYNIFLTLISVRNNILKNVLHPALFFLSGCSHLWAEHNVDIIKGTEVQRLYELASRVCEINSVTEENNSSKAKKQIPSSSVYSCESEEDLNEGSAPELGAIEPA